MHFVEAIPRMEFCIKITEPDQGLFIVADSKCISQKIQAREKKFGKRVHVNRKELETQIALIEHFEKVHAQSVYRNHINRVELFNDHWNSTWYAFLELLEENEAYILGKDNEEVFSMDKIVKSSWRESSIEGMTYGGVLIKNVEGMVLIKTQTWLS
jgi:hypothetical protein